MKSTCWSHGTYDSGEWGLGSCPVCAVEKAIEQHTDAMERIHEEETEAREEAAFRREQAAAQAASRAEKAAARAARENKKALSEDWKLRSRARSDRAYALYEAKLFDDALKTSQEAIEEDRGNISAYITAAWASRQKGEVENANGYFDTLVSLLNLPDYSIFPYEFWAVLGWLPNGEEELVRKFSAVLRENLSRWNFKKSYGDIIKLLNMLIERELPADARFLMESLLSKSDKLAFDADLTALTDKLIDRGLLQDAQFFMKSMASRTDRLLPTVYLCEITRRLGEEDTDTVTNFLNKTSFDKRGRILDDFNTVVLREERFSASTIAQVKDAIRVSYEQWRPEIDKAFTHAAAEYARQRLAQGYWWHAFIWIVAIAGVFLFPPLVVVALRQFVELEELKQFDQPVLWLIFAVPPITGIFVHRLLAGC